MATRRLPSPEDANGMRRRAIIQGAQIPFVQEGDRARWHLISEPLGPDALLIGVKLLPVFGSFLKVPYRPKRPFGAGLRYLGRPASSARGFLELDFFSTDFCLGLRNCDGPSGPSISGSSPHAAARRPLSRMEIVSALTVTPSTRSADSAREKLSRVIPSSDAIRFFS